MDKLLARRASHAGARTRTILRRAVGIAVLPVVVLGALALAPSAANAADHIGTGTAAVKVIRTVAEPTAADRAANVGASTCGVKVVRGAYTGYALCGTIILDYQYTNGIWETFVVGTTSSNNIYHIWQRYAGDPTWTGWQTLPGHGTAVDGIYFFTQGTHDSIVIEVLGTTGSYYCNARSTSWAGWYLC